MSLRHGPIPFEGLGNRGFGDISSLRHYTKVTKREPVTGDYYLERGSGLMAAWLCSPQDSGLGVRTIVKPEN